MHGVSWCSSFFDVLELVLNWQLLTKRVKKFEIILLIESELADAVAQLTVTQP